MAPDREEAKKFVKDMTLHTWNNYVKQAYGHDEVGPISGKAKDVWGYHSITLVDALGTLWLMDMKTEFREGVQYLGQHLIKNMEKHSGLQSLFELNIRLLGGLEGAHSLCLEEDPSSAEILLGLAKEIGDRFLPAFEGMVLPCKEIDLSNPNNKGECPCDDLAGGGTFTMEFRYLSHHTGDPKYAFVADTAMRALMKASGGTGLVSNKVKIDDIRKPLSKQTVSSVGTQYWLGGGGDSYYEYLLKTYLLSCQRPEDALYLSEFRALFQSVKKRNMVHDINENSTMIGTNRMQEHLACFVPGTLMLGDAMLANHPDVSAEERAEWRNLARKTATFCADAYAKSPIGIGTEQWNSKFQSQGWVDRWILRPEVIESIYYMHYFTGEEEWRDRAWTIANKIRQHTQKRYGFATVTNIHSHPTNEDQQESFFIAETLKYLYLIHVGPQDFNPTEFIFTTEAHPLRKLCDHNTATSQTTFPDVIVNLPTADRTLNYSDSFSPRVADRIEGSESMAKVIEKAQRIVQDEATRIATLIRERHGNSAAIDADKMSRVFQRSYAMNALDTWKIFKPDDSVFVTTGDINNMWLRDSSVQMTAYLPLASQQPDDSPLRKVFDSVLYRQNKFIESDPYATGFYRTTSPTGVNDGPCLDRCQYDPIKCPKCKCHDCFPPCGDYTLMHEFELDSLLYPALLNYDYWQQTKYSKHLDDGALIRLWKKTVMPLLRTEQYHMSKSKYRMHNGWYREPSPVKDGIGLIWTFARPSDDQATYNYNIPHNIMAVVVLVRMSEIAVHLQDSAFAQECLNLAREVDRGIHEYGVVDHNGERIYAFEVNGLGKYTLEDDANMPNLLWQPHINYDLNFRRSLWSEQADAPDLSQDFYPATRKFVLSKKNPNYFADASAGFHGLGSKHVSSDIPGPHGACRGHCVWHLGMMMEGIYNFTIFK